MMVHIAHILKVVNLKYLKIKNVLSSANHKKKMFLLLQRGGLIVITFA
jgi:hypothetical protein